MVDADADTDANSSFNQLETRQTNTANIILEQIEATRKPKT